MKKKLSIKSLKINSFQTKVTTIEPKTIKGGESDFPCGGMDSSIDMSQDCGGSGSGGYFFP